MMVTQEDTPLAIFQWFRYPQERWRYSRIVQPSYFETEGWEFEPLRARQSFFTKRLNSRNISLLDVSGRAACETSTAPATTNRPLTPAEETFTSDAGNFDP